MSDDVAIKVENLSKRYVINHQRAGGDGLRHVLQDKLTAPLRWLGGKIQSRPPAVGSPKSEISIPGSGSRTAASEEFWALKDVSFEIKQGEAVGIIGRNGAGKSTLLKILSRITEPTSGQITIAGRVASLLEVGTGFHPELTGRENIFLNGAILGMSRKEIKSKFDEIVAFAEVERFLDTPVKRYSSGMYVRLAFAVAAHLDPEILIVDEVLAVGDAQFQKKCLGKMQEVSTGRGRTVLFVSHNMSAVKGLCKRAILLREGAVIRDGPADIVVGQYLGGDSSSDLDLNWKDAQNAPGDSRTWLRRLKLEAEPLDPMLGITTASGIRIIAEYWNDVADAELNLSLVLYTADDICVFNTWSEAKRIPRGGVRSICHIPAHFLNDERYRIRLLIVRDGSVALMDRDNLLWFEVRDADRKGSWFGKVIGATRPQFAWETTPLRNGE